jgi:hypothetical protein
MWFAVCEDYSEYGQDMGMALNMWELTTEEFVGWRSEKASRLSIKVVLIYNATY